MVGNAVKTRVHDTPYSIRNKGPIPDIGQEEGMPTDALNIAWVDDSRKHLYHWSKGLKWYERLHAHATLTSIRKNVRCKRPFAPKDELDYVLDAAYCPNKETFSEKGDVYIQRETAFGEDMYDGVYARNLAKCQEQCGVAKRAPDDNLSKPKQKSPESPQGGSWRLMRNRTVVYPEKTIPKGYSMIYSMGSVNGEPVRRENIYNVKLGIAADHSPQTNPGYSRTPSGAFYSI